MKQGVVMRKFLFLLALFFLYNSVAYSQNSVINENEKIEKFHQKLTDVIGKEFWIKNNPNAKFKRKFKYQAKTHRLNYNEFEVSKDEKFIVIGWELDYNKREHLKLQFSEDKIGYLEVWHLIDSTKILDGVFNGYEYSDDVEYLFDEDPNVALPRQMEEINKWKLKTAQEVEQEKLKLSKEISNENRLKKQAIDKEKAAFKAKGGVSIGMTKERVLKSNWGKPNKINRTTNAYGVTEQWVYGNGNYLYFDNGILSSIQN